MDRDRWEKPSLFRLNRTRSRTDPFDDQLGLGKGRHPLLLLLAVWAGGIGLMVGLSLVLPRTAAGLADLVIIVALLLTVRI
jgi:hypothetical protein